jgi:hypothetical protein
LTGRNSIASIQVLRASQRSCRRPPESSTIMCGCWLFFAMPNAPAQVSHRKAAGAKIDLGRSERGALVTI